MEKAILAESWKNFKQAQIETFFEVESEKGKKRKREEKEDEKNIPAWLCQNCGGDSFTERDGSDVCDECATAVPGVYRFDFSDLSHCEVLRKDYYAPYYMAELLKAFQGCDVFIPSDIFHYIKKAWINDGKKNPDNLLQSDVQRILAKTKIPERVAIANRSRKTDRFLNVKIYGEKWKQIKRRLGGKCKYPTSDLVNFIQDVFVSCFSLHEQTRHKKECNGERGCHKSFGCRKNIGPYKFLISEIIKRYDEKMYEDFKDEFVCRGAKKMKNNNTKTILDYSFRMIRRN